MTTRRSPLTASRLTRLALTGVLAGGLFSVAGCHWLLWMHGDDLEVCDDIYEDCMDWASNEQERQTCRREVEDCYEACDGSWEDEGGDDSVADEGDSGNGDADAGGEQGNDDGDSDDGDDGDAGDDGDDGDTGGDPGVCIDLFANCLGSAEDLADVEACEALFDHCIDPGQCRDCGGCPTEDLDACLSSYASCSALADTPEKVELCGAAFDTCVAPFAAECQVSENPNLGVCLDQHELCVACAEDDEQLGACQLVFDSCMSV